MKNFITKMVIGVFAATIASSPSYAAWDQGLASYYGGKHAGRITANGEKFNLNAMTAASHSFPFNTMVRVIDVETHKSVVVRINDHGPYQKVGTHYVPHPTRIIDLSQGAAKRLGLISGCKTKNCEPGIKQVKIEVVSIPKPKVASLYVSYVRKNVRMADNRSRHR